MKVSINAQADLELTEGALYYARKANKFIAEALLSEFERSFDADVPSASFAGPPFARGEEL